MAAPGEQFIDRSDSEEEEGDGEILAASSSTGRGGARHGEFGASVSGNKTKFIQLQSGKFVLPGQQGLWGCAAPACLCPRAKPTCISSSRQDDADDSSGAKRRREEESAESSLPSKAAAEGRGRAGITTDGETSAL